MKHILFYILFFFTINISAQDQYDVARGSFPPNWPSNSLDPRSEQLKQFEPHDPFIVILPILISDDLSLQLEEIIIAGLNMTLDKEEFNTKLSNLEISNKYFYKLQQSLINNLNIEKTLKKEIIDTIDLSCKYFMNDDFENLKEIVVYELFLKRLMPKHEYYEYLDISIKTDIQLIQNNQLRIILGTK